MCLPLPIVRGILCYRPAGISLLAAIFTGFLVTMSSSFPAENADEVAVGPFSKIYDPSAGEQKPWYINDHCFIQGADGTWHMFGITHAEPANPLQERIFAHATAPILDGPWTKQAGVMEYDPTIGETHVWAPFVVKDKDTYYMFYCAGGAAHDQYRLNVATSKDLWNWTRHPGNPVVVDGFDARDPMVARIGDQWVLYYCATSEPKGGNHIVVAMTSDDLIHWKDRKVVFVHPNKGTSGGPTESPYVVQHNGKYYLFLCTNAPYDNTAVYVSDSPFQWDIVNKVGSFPAHAAEVIEGPGGKWYVSRAGWGKGGLYLAELTWLK